MKTRVNDKSKSPETAAAGTISVAFKAIKDAVCTASTC